MDGNNRWAIKNDQNKEFSYNFGARKLLNISNYLFKNYEIKYISAFALSTHNLKRSIKFINIFNKVFSKCLADINTSKINFSVVFIGDLTFLSKKDQNLANEIQIKTNKYSKKLIIFINYSGQSDILNAINNKFSNKKYDLKLLESSLLTKAFPNPDLLIRTGGYQRLSDFMLFQLNFTELFFTKTLWPDINITYIEKVLNRYSNIDRKYGV